ncbi:DoxX family protein [Aurantibacillus circumpalustris]|uniref:DoxX family protein n=1 Tax=Aurantibacillus circumpalustris TaxID=3036359 RepID=UPI00295B5F23|nr:DoxX family protein [Aurantibacillus circumpalustris]
MKKTNIIYWIFTSLFSVLMIFSSIGGFGNDPEATKFMSDLGYPAYFVFFISLAKILGVIAILIPGYPRIKEWAYAGLIFDLAGATYSQIAAGMPTDGLIFMAISFTLAFGSYLYYHKRLKEKAQVTT